MHLSLPGAGEGCTKGCIAATGGDTLAAPTSAPTSVLNHILVDPPASCAICGHSDGTPADVHR